MPAVLPAARRDLDDAREPGAADRRGRGGLEVDVLRGGAVPELAEAVTRACERPAVRYAVAQRYAVRLTALYALPGQGLLWIGCHRA